ncbi:hypothetical protein Plhal304r1_c007g0029871 [Plasmopara halstedii]
MASGCATTRVVVLTSCTRNIVTFVEQISRSFWAVATMMRTSIVAVKRARQRNVQQFYDSELSFR